MQKELYCKMCHYSIAIHKEEGSTQSIKTNYKVRSSECIVENNNTTHIVKCRCGSVHKITLSPLTISEHNQLRSKSILDNKKINL